MRGDCRNSASVRTGIGISDRSGPNGAAAHCSARTMNIRSQTPLPTTTRHRN